MEGNRARKEQMEMENWERVGGGGAVEGNRLKRKMEESKIIGERRTREQREREQWERDERRVWKWVWNRLRGKNTRHKKLWKGIGGEGKGKSGRRMERERQ